jgi:hypothetical protein
MKTKKFFERRINGQMHPFPKNLEITIRKRIQGIFTYLVITDHASYLHFANNPDGYQQLIDRLKSVGFSNGIDDESWNDFKLILNEKPHPLNQQVVFNIEFAWDRFLNEIGRFIVVANKEIGITYSSKDERTIKRFHLAPFKEIVDCLNRNMGPTLIHDQEIDSVNELSLLRNLGVHNDWIIDEEYCTKTKNQNLIIGEIRDVTIEEVIPLYSDLLSSMSKIASLVSFQYKAFQNGEFE